MLSDLGLLDPDASEPKIPIIEAWNKWDLLDADRAAELAEQVELHDDEVVVPISALTGEGCEALLAKVGQVLTSGAKLHKFSIPATDGQRIAWLHANGEVSLDGEGGIDDRGPLRQLEVRLTPRDLGRFSRL